MAVQGLYEIRTNIPSTGKKFLDINFDLTTSLFELL